MKTNLDGFYKSNTELEKEGKWFELSPGVEFKLRRMGGGNSTELKKIHAKLFKPYAFQIQSGALPAEKEIEISTKVFIEACMVDWKGVEIDGEFPEFSPELAFALFQELPNLCDLLIRTATSESNYREALGNSQPTASNGKLIGQVNVGKLVIKFWSNKVK